MSHYGPPGGHPPPAKRQYSSNRAEDRRSNDNWNRRNWHSDNNQQQWESQAGSTRAGNHHRPANGRGFATNDQHLKNSKQESPFPYLNAEANHQGSNSKRSGNAFVNHQQSEFQARQELCQKLEEQGDMKKRIKEFRKLAEKEKSTLFLPKEVHFVQLPEQHYADDWVKHEDRVLHETKTWLHQQKWVTDEEDGEESETDDEMDAPPSKLEVHVEFLEALPLCMPMIMGFHTSFNEHNVQWCYCPCGPHMKLWRETCNINGVFPISETAWSNKKCKAKKNKPHEFIQHVREESKSCGAHLVILEYLNRLYSDFHGVGIRHIAFEHLKTRKWQATQDFLLKQEQK
jgi:hypothetical protein